MVSTPLNRPQGIRFWKFEHLVNKIRYLLVKSGITIATLKFQYKRWFRGKKILRIRIFLGTSNFWVFPECFELKWIEYAKYKWYKMRTVRIWHFLEFWILSFRSFGIRIFGNLSSDSDFPNLFTPESSLILNFKVAVVIPDLTRRYRILISKGSNFQSGFQIQIPHGQFRGVSRETTENRNFSFVTTSTKELNLHRWTSRSSWAQGWYV